MKLALVIPIHSVIDIITNSSTEIFTYSNGTIEPFKKVVEEMFKIHNINKTFDEVFVATVLCDDGNYMDSDARPDDVTDDMVKDMLELYKKGERDLPQWMKDVEEDTNWSEYTPDTYLFIHAKDPAYVEFAELIKKFLYSPDHDASSDY